MNFKDFISFFFFIVGFSMFGMESDKIVAHVITYDNGYEEASISIDQEILNILKRSKTIKNFLEDVKEITNNNEPIEIPLPDLSLEDFKLALPYLSNCNENVIDQIILLPNNLSDLVRLFTVADYLDVPSLEKNIESRIENFDIRNLDIDKHELTKIPQNVLNVINDKVEKKYDNFFNEQLKPIIHALSTKCIKDRLQKPDENSNTLLSRFKSWITNYTNSKNTNKYNEALLSPDGSKLALFFDNTVNIWDTKTLKCITTLKHDSVHFYYKPFFSPQGNYLVTWFPSNKGSFTYIWNIATKNCLKIPSCFDSLFSPNEKFFVQKTDPGFEIYNLETNKHTTIESPVERWQDRDSVLTFTSNDQLFISLRANGIIKVWDPQTGQCIRSFPGLYKFFTLNPNNVIITIAQAIYQNDVSIDIIDVEKSKILAKFSAYPNSIALSQNNNLVAFRSVVDNSIKIYDIQKQVISSINNFLHMESLAFSPKDTYLLAKRDQRDQINAIILIWDIAKGKLIFSEKGSSPEFNEDETILAYSQDQKITLWNVEKHQYIHFPESHYWGTDWSFSPDGTLLFCFKNNAVWDLNTGKCLNEKPAWLAKHNLLIDTKFNIDDDSNQTDFTDLKKRQNYFFACYALSMQQKLFLCWAAKAKQNNVEPKNIERFLNNYLGPNSARPILNQVFNINLKPYTPLTDLADTAKKAYLLSTTFKKKRLS